MNSSTKNIYRCIIHSWMQLLVYGLLTLAFAQAALSADSLYQNNGVVNYPAVNTFPPMIDATNFVNNGQFIINFTTFNTVIQPFYETSDTVNYTNNGSMVANTGFQFDNQSSSDGSRTSAGSFVNFGSISCGSINNLGDPFLGELFLFGFFPQCLVTASNIVNPGSINVGEDGMIQLSGNNVDLTRATLTMEDNTANISGTGWYGLNTNFWDPTVDLGPTFAESAFFPIPPFFLFLPASTAYFNFASPTPSNNIIRTVFIEDTSGPDVSYNVYFDTAGLGFGSGNVTIEWVGTYQDIASGGFFNDYLYLNDDYLEGVSTNLGPLGGIPFNFTFTESPTKLIFQAPAPAGFFPVFTPGTITNRYSVANVDLIATTVDTNAIANQAITNLPGRIQISAANDLDMSYAQISGDNYMSIFAPTQFEGTAGATIFSPFSDVNVGVTNGFLTISNLTSPFVPTWSGNIQAWNTEWTELTSNLVVTATSTNLIAVTNDFRVLIVGSQLSPIALAQVQDMFLHGTNSLVLSDTVNLIRHFSSDAQNMTLTANGIGNGATSIDGELNMQGSGVNWQPATPYLRNLTNDGAIRLGNLQQFGTSAPLLTSNFTVIPGLAAMTATGKLSEISFTNVAMNDAVTIGTNKYVFVPSFSKRGVGNEVKIGATLNQSMLNLIAAIDNSAGSGVAYSSKTVTNRQVFAYGLGTNGSFALTAKVSGAAGNSILTTTTSKRLTWNGHGTLVGGVTATGSTTNVVVTVTGGHYNSLVNNGFMSDQGAMIWADNFVNSGTISNDIGSFALFSLTAAMTNDTTNVVFTAGGDVSFTADTLVISNTFLEAGRSLTLTATNLLTDGGLGSSNIWIVGSNSFGSGISLPIKPLLGDLLGTTITNYAPTNRNVINIWSGNDLGTTVAGFTNNEAIGRLVLDAFGAVPNTEFTFRGSGNANALYVGDLQLLDSATNQDSGNNFIALNIETNMVIYYANAEIEGLSIAQKMNGKNGNRLRWISAFTNVINASLAMNGTATAQSRTISPTADSDGDGIPNASDPTPLFTPGQVNLHTGTVKNGAIPVIWNSIPSSTNYLYRSTNGASGPFNQLVTNFVSPSPAPPVGGWPITNIVYDPIIAPMQFYSVIVVPNSAQFYGP